MKNLTIAALAILLSSCFYSGMDDESTYVDPKLQPYLDSFIEEAKARGIVVTPVYPKISFSTTINKSGVSYRNTETILINPNSDSWQMQPEQLVFHELAHQYLHREHVDSMDEFNEPVSLMHSDNLPFYNVNFMGPQIFRHSRAHYMNELFAH
jgi:hypothetical protein